MKAHERWMGLMFLVAIWPVTAARGEKISRFAWLHVGEVQPRGWLLEQIRTDMTDGYGPVLDKLTDRIDPNVFDTRNQTKIRRPKKGGVWWNGETTGNWLDGFVRAAYYSGDAAAKRRVDELVAQILAMQEADGYLGIYPKTLRFEQPIVTQNGEFWTQACLYRGLLAYHEFTGRADVLAAVERAVKLMISQYGPERQYWSKCIVRGGPTHNIMFVDVCEWLWQKTGDQAYADFARFIYDTYSDCTDVFETGVQLQNLADADKLFKGHGAHVMEHLRVPLFVAYASGDPKYRAAVSNIFPKTDRHLAAGGACISDEDILERLGGPEIGCEYCTMLELVHSLESGVQKMGRADLGDRIEVLAFNSAEGARLRDGKAIQYCTEDNQHAASIAAGKGRRFKLSPTHEDVAACCAVTALKFFPYFIGGLWMKEKDGSGLVAIAYAPTVVQTKINGTTVAVESETSYPFEDEVRMTMHVEKPIRFNLRLRAPVWAGGMNIAAPGADVRNEDGWRVVTKEWQTGDKVTLSFTPEVVRKTAVDGSGVYWQRGPLIYALPIASERKKTKDYPVAGFADWDYTPVANTFWDYAVSTNCGHFVFAREKLDAAANPWANPPVALTGTLLKRTTGQVETVRLVPMGASLLRHTVFADTTRVVKQPTKQFEWLKSDTNVARKAEVVVSNSAKGYQRNAIIDGVVDGFPKNPTAEWASNGGGAGTTVKLVWEMPETVGSVWLFDRPNPVDQVLAATIKFSDGSTAEVGALPNDAAKPFRLNFAPKTITWMEVVVTRVSSQNHNVGFAEIAVFAKEPDEGATEPAKTPTPPAPPTAGNIWGVDYRYFSPTNWIGAIGLPDDAFKCTVDGRGALVTEFGRADQLAIYPNRPAPHYVAILAGVEEGAHVVEQRMHSPRAPVTLTKKRCGEVAITEQLFLARPLDWDAMATGAALQARPSKPDARQYLLMTEYLNTGKAPVTLTPVLTIEGNAPAATLAQSRSAFHAASNTRGWTTRDISAFESLAVPPQSKAAKRAKARLEKMTLAPGAAARWVLAIERNGYASQAPVEWAEAETLRNAAIGWWEKSARLPYDVIQLPDPEIQAVLDTSIRELYQMRYSIRGLPAFYFGPGVYNSYWVLDGSFVSEAVAMLGRTQDADGNIEYMLLHKQADGRIEVMPKHWKETGIALLTIYRHARLIQSKEWLNRHWDVYCRAVEAIRQMRRSESSSDPAAPNYRLAPVGFGDGGIGVGAEYTNNHWLLAGLHSAIEAARWLGKQPEADAWEAEYRDFQNVFRKAIHRDAKTDAHGNTYIPVMMSDQKNVSDKDRKLYPGLTPPANAPLPPTQGQWAFCHAVYPGRIFAKDDPLMLGTLRMMQTYEVQGGVVEFGGWGDVWTQFGASFYGHDWLWLGDGQKAARGLYAFANHASPWRNFCEEMSIKGRGAKVLGDMPHVSASAEFIRLTGHLLAFDRDDELHLLEGMPPAWANPGMITRVNGLVTPFGTLSMDVTVADDGKAARLRVKPLSNPACRKLILHVKGWTGSQHDRPLELNPKKTHDLTIVLTP